MPEQQSPAQIQAVPGSKESVREQDKIMLVLAYLGVLSLIPLITVKDSEYVKWHAKHGLVLGVGGGIALAMLFGLLNAIGGFFGTMLSCAVWVAFIVVDILAMVKALNGERWRIPVVTDVSEKL